MFVLTIKTPTVYSLEGGEKKGRKRKEKESMVMTYDENCME